MISAFNILSRLSVGGPPILQAADALLDWLPRGKQNSQINVQMCINQGILPNVIFQRTVRRSHSPITSPRRGRIPSRGPANSTPSSRLPSSIHLASNEHPTSIQRAFNEHLRPHARHKYRTDGHRNCRRMAIAHSQ